MWDKFLEVFIGKWVGTKLQKELETHKNELQKKTYVSKVRFDAEFKIYYELFEAWSKIYFAVIMMTDESLYSNHVVKIVDKRKEDYFGADTIDLLNEQFVKIFAHAPFIKEEMYNKFYELYRLFRRAANMATGIDKTNIDAKTPNNNNSERYEQLSEFTKKAEKEYYETIKEIRNYLSSLEVKEE